MDLSITIRPIEQKDNKALAEVIRSVFREFKVDRPGTVYTDPTTDHLFELFQTKGSAYFVAEENGVIVGGCGFFPTDQLPKGYCELVKFFLLPQFRGKGLGLELMQNSMNLAKQTGYSHIYLESFPELAKAVSMYDRAGFKHIDHALGNSGHHACTIWMVKEL
jgi:putative acetyltransferase